MDERFVRTEMLIGAEGLDTLKNASVLLFGLGGVGSACAEALVRAGIGKITVCDGDNVSLSNVNRQLCALTSTVGKKKTDTVRARLLDINPDCEVTVIDTFFTPETALDLAPFDAVADCIDDVPAKIEIIRRAVEAGKEKEIFVISSMGTGNRLDPEQLTVTDIAKTEGDPLARKMRRELRLIGINHLPVLCSKETPVTPILSTEETGTRIGSISFVPPVAGYLIASAVIRHLLVNVKSNANAEGSSAKTPQGETIP